MTATMEVSPATTHRSGWLDRFGAALEAGNGDVIGLTFRYASSHRANAHFRHKLHRYARCGLHILQIVDQLGQILDRVDIMVRRR